jgi:iron complex outermembrane receptor protein
MLMPMPTPPTVVAGSAIRAIDAQTHSVVRVLDRGEWAPVAGEGLGELLQRLPFMGASAPNLNSNTLGDGSVVADIGGLGPARCVVMLNGHRLPINELTGAPAVDLDVIPASSVDRIEILLGGASVVWGADAVGGVINIITRAEAEGTQLTASGSRSARSDGSAEKVSLFHGNVAGRGHLSVAAEYRHQDPITSDSRPFSARTEALSCLEGSGCVIPFGSTATPEGAFQVPQGNRLGLPQGVYTRDPSNGTWHTLRAVGASNDLYSTATDSFLRDGRSGGSLVTNAGLDLSAATTLGVDALIANDRTRRQLPPLPLTTVGASSAVMGTGAGGATLVPTSVPASNFYNPFGVALPSIQRRLVELGPRSLIDDSDLQFVAATLRHETGAWEWEGSLTWGRSQREEHLGDLIRPDRLALAIGPSGRDPTGAIRCGTPDPQTGIVNNPLAGCVPLDLFDGPGSIGRPMLDYITEPADDSTRMTSTAVSVIGRRELTHTGGRVALGLESQRLQEHSSFADSGPFTAIDPVPGEGSLLRHDLFAEISFPWSGRPGTVSTVTAGTRLSKAQGESLIGSAFAALAWRAADPLLLRARFAQVYRQPSVAELFLGRYGRTLPLSNPCLSATNQGSAPCEATGAAHPPGQTGFTAAANEANYFIAGNPELRPERGYSASGGLVWNSSEHRERLVSVDLTWVRLSDAIRAPGIAELIASCRSGVYPGACGRVIAVPDSGSFIVNGKLINGGRDEAARVDLEATDARLTRWGTWKADLQVGYLLRRRMTDITGAEIDLRNTFDLTRSVQGTAYPAIRGQARLQWTHAAWAADWRLEYVGSYRETTDRNGLLSSTGAALRQVGSVAYQDWTLSWRFRESSFVRLAMLNAFDRFPPRVNSGLQANTDAPTYRLEGRTFALGLEWLL